jgi:hypothetical protein
MLVKLTPDVKKGFHSELLSKKFLRSIDLRTGLKLLPMHERTNEIQRNFFRS